MTLAHLLAGRRSRPLREIVNRLEVSERTAYRDLADLSRSLPIGRDEHGYRLLEAGVRRPSTWRPPSTPS
jgi:predicted DNA-binding transcriptional regulator YafY